MAVACFFGFTQIQRSKGDILKDGGAEELVVGVLKEQSDAPPDFSKVFFFVSPGCRKFQGVRRWV